MARRGRQTILSRHTCRHRVDELLEIVAGLEADFRQLNFAQRHAPVETV
jgi:spore maturation protein CgeB